MIDSLENWVLTQETSIKDVDEKLSLTKKENVVNNDDVSVEELRLKVIQLEKGMAKVDDKKQNITTTIKCKECGKAFEKTFHLEHKSSCQLTCYYKYGYLKPVKQKICVNFLSGQTLNHPL